MHRILQTPIGRVAAACAISLICATTVFVTERTAEAHAATRGNVDLVTVGGATIRVAGWAITDDYPGAALGIIVRVDGTRIYPAPPSYVLADLYRPDVGAAFPGFGDYHGFDFTISATVQRTVCVQAQRVGVYNQIGACWKFNTPNGNATISGVAGPSRITMQTKANFAGAFGSLTWGGKQFIDAHDKGRLLQSSLSPVTECYNPTEGGAARDAIEPNPHTSSALFNIAYNSRQVYTESRPASWYQPAGCPPALPGATEQLRWTFAKSVLVGASGLAHSVLYDTSWQSPPDEGTLNMQVEALTAYLKPDLNLYFRIERSGAANYIGAWSPGGSLLTMGTPGDIPIVATLSGGAYALGLYCPGASYHSAWSGIAVPKLNAVFENQSFAPSTTKYYRCFLAVGSLANVAVTMSQIFATYGV